MRAALHRRRFDFKAARKQIQVHPDKHGLLLFRFQGKLYHYRVCHFGGRFSAFWWQRTGAFMLCPMHGLLAMPPHKAWLFVDDLLAALCRPAGGEQLAIMAIFFCAISALFPGKKPSFRSTRARCRPATGPVTRKARFASNRNASSHVSHPWYTPCEQVEHALFTLGICAGSAKGMQVKWDRPRPGSGQRLLKTSRAIGPAGLGPLFIACLLLA